MYMQLMNERDCAGAGGEKPLSTGCLCANLRRASRAVTRVYEEEFRKAGFTGATQFHVLRVVKRAGSLRQGNLGVLLDLDKTTVTRTLKPLFEKGWLALKAGEDGRERWVALTEAGAKQIERGRPAWDKAQARMKEALPRGMWDVFIETLPKLAELSVGA
jgi:DNA-binding MarR family transcriptional regulator